MSVLCAVVCSFVYVCLFPSASMFVVRTLVQAHGAKGREGLGGVTVPELGSSCTQ